MKSVFVDTAYWIAIVLPDDQHHDRARAARGDLGDVILVTTDEVLTEFLNFFNQLGPPLREAAVKMANSIMANVNVRVLAQTRGSFLSGIQLYDSRRDKGYSLVDCISMDTMRAEGIQEVLTHDHHFTQEGFMVLIK